MAASGYNVVRVFIEDAAVGNPNGQGVNPAYMQNVADFLQLARNNNMYVLITFWAIPREGGYQPTTALPNDLEGQNATYLWQPFIDAKKRYVQDFITALQTMNAPLDTIFAWEIENEPHFQTDQMPLSLTSGVVTTANGSSYDMSNPTDRQRKTSDTWRDRRPISADAESIHDSSTSRRCVAKPSDTLMQRRISDQWLDSLYMGYDRNR